MPLHHLIWLAAGLVLLGLEAVVPGTIIMWFGVGGVLTALGVWTGVLSSGTAQWLFFFLSSFAFLIGWIFLFKRFFKKKDRTDVRDPTLLDLRGRVTKAISAGIPGEVELYQTFHGLKKWAAEAAESLAEGAEIEVEESKGIKLVVKKFQGGVS